MCGALKVTGTILRDREYVPCSLNAVEHAPVTPATASKLIGSRRGSELLTPVGHSIRGSAIHAFDTKRKSGMSGFGQELSNSRLRAWLRDAGSNRTESPPPPSSWSTISRPQPCQGWGRGFESLRPLQFSLPLQSSTSRPPQGDLRRFVLGNRLAAGAAARGCRSRLAVYRSVNEGISDGMDAAKFKTCRRH